MAEYHEETEKLRFHGMKKEWAREITMREEEMQDIMVQKKNVLERLP